MLGSSRRRYELLSRPWSFKLLEAASPLAGFKLTKRLIPWFRDHELCTSCLPVNEDIELSEGVVMPINLLCEFIDRASHRVIVEWCACRVAHECKRYPKDVACLMMGDSALEIDPSFRREVGPEEAKRHANLAVEKGLIPFVGKARIDNLVFGIKNKKQLLSVCFCCECCCITRFARHVPPEMRANNVVKLEGLEVKVTGDCDGCGACAERCFLKVIEIRDGKAEIGEGCAGCGRCATVCRRKAIKVSLNNPSFIDEARSRIEAFVDFE